MVSVVAIGLFNALAFAGASFAFSEINKSGYKSEMKRHNNAIEKLARAKEAWQENEVAKHDKIQRLRQELSDANADVNETDRALDELGKALSVRFEGETLAREPRLAHYYHKSAEMKNYELLFIGAVGVAGGFAARKLFM